MSINVRSRSNTKVAWVTSLVPPPEKWPGIHCLSMHNCTSITRKTWESMYFCNWSFTPDSLLYHHANGLNLQGIWKLINVVLNLITTYCWNFAGRNFHEKLFVNIFVEIIAHEFTVKMPHPYKGCNILKTSCISHAAVSASVKVRGPSSSWKQMLKWWCKPRAWRISNNLQCYIANDTA